MSGAARRRLFLAGGLDESTRDLLAAHLQAHAPGGLPGRAVRPDNWHLTLRFLGWTTDLQRDGILRSLDEASLPGPFDVRFGGLGAFPKERRATVLWIGVDRGGAALGDLAAACDEAAQAVGFTSEDRPFHPHLTISRIRPHEDVTALVDAVAPFPVKMPITAITLYESHLHRGGAIYESVDSIEL